MAWSVYRLILVVALVLVVANVGNALMVLAAVLCFGGVAGYEFSNSKMPFTMGSWAFVSFADPVDQSMGQNGAQLATRFFPGAEVTPFMGYMFLLMLAFIAFFLVVQIDYTMDYIEKKRAAR